MLKTRILTALALLPLVLGCLFLGPPALWGGFVLLALSIGAWEWSRLARFGTRQAQVFIGSFVALGLVTLGLPTWDSGLAAGWNLALDSFSLLFWLLLVPLWLRQRWPLSNAWLAAVIGWLVLLAALAAVTRFRELRFAQIPEYGGAVVLLLILALAWVADIAAYFAGRRFGRRKLAPNISPGKSWEGVYGALVAVAVYLTVLHQLQVPLFSAMPLWLLLPLGWALTGVSVMGDLFESLLKRQAGLKDSSNLLPGHGGVLDRVDSLLALAAVAAALLFTLARLAIF